MCATILGHGMVIVRKQYEKDSKKTATQTVLFVCTSAHLGAMFSPITTDAPPIICSSIVVNGKNVLHCT
jgi:hypothetical protein